MLDKLLWRLADTKVDLELTKQVISCDYWRLIICLAFAMFKGLHACFHSVEVLFFRVFLENVHTTDNISVL